MSRDPVVTPASGPATPQSIVASQSLKAMAADPRTTNLLLLVMVLCISGYMPESLNTLCGV